MADTIIEVKPVFFIATDLTPKLAGEIFLTGENLTNVSYTYRKDYPKQAKAAFDNKIPFSIMLPNNLNKYAELPKPSWTITMRSGLVRLNACQDVGLHSTKQNEEMLAILEGQAPLFH